MLRQGRLSRPALPVDQLGGLLTAAVDGRGGKVGVTGGRIWYRIVGGGEAVPLVTVHGGPGGTHEYLEPFEALADDRPVVSYDWVGAGKSDAPDDVSLWTNDRMIDELGMHRPRSVESGSHATLAGTLNLYGSSVQGPRKRCWFTKACSSWSATQPAVRARQV